MLSTGEVWNPKDLSRVETDDKDKLKFTKNNLKQDIKQLSLLGLTSEEIMDIVKSQNANI